MEEKQDTILEENFDLNIGLTGITRRIDAQQITKLPETNSFDPSDGKVEEKLTKVLNVRTSDGMIMQLLRPQIKDRSLLSPLMFRKKICEIRTLLTQNEQLRSELGRDCLSQIDTILAEEEDKSDLLDQYRHTLLLG